MQKKTSVLRYTIFISVLLHLIVIYFVSQSAQFPQKLELLSPPTNIIDARLILTPTRTAPTASELAAPQRADRLPKEKQVIATTPVSEVVDEPLPVETHKAPEEKLELADPAITSAPEIKPATRFIPPTDKFESPVRSMAKKHLGSFQHSQQTRLAQQAAKNFQTYQDAPLIDGEIKDKFLTQDEKLRANLKVRADCSSTGKKTAAVVLNFLGGRIDCSRPPAIDEYIQKRLNKTSSYPEQNKQLVNKRPKSVVIQE